MKYILKISFVAFLFLLNYLSIFASSTEEFTYEYQLNVALKRQQAGVLFDAPLETSEGWQQFFDQGVRRVETVLETDTLVEEDQKTELHTMLELVAAKGENLFTTGEMDTHWYAFLHRLMGEVLSRVQAKQEGVYEDLFYHSYPNPDKKEEYEEKEEGEIVYYARAKNFSILVKTFEKTLFLRKNHLKEVRVFLCSKQELEDKSSVHYNFSIGDSPFEETAYFLLMKTSFPIIQDCFYLPFIGSQEEVLFPVPLMNRATTHRICSVGYPTVPTAFDGGLLSTATKFGNHDLIDHGIIFRALPGTLIMQLNVEEDPLLQVIHPLLEKIEDHPNKSERGALQAGFFRATHEFDWRFLLRPTLGTRPFTDAVNPNRWKEEIQGKQTSLYYPLTLPMENEFSFFQEHFRRFDVEVTGPFDPTNFTYELSKPENPIYYFSVEPKSFAAAEDLSKKKSFVSFDQENHVISTKKFNYARYKTVLWDQYQMLIDLGVDLPSSLKTEDGDFFTEDTLNRTLVAKYFQEVIYPLLLKVAQS